MAWRTWWNGWRARWTGHPPAWTGVEDVAPSSAPPAGFGNGPVPQLVSLGFDDNGQPSGMAWVCDLLRDRCNPHGAGVLDDEPVRATFYVTSIYGRRRAVRRAWRRAYREGHEIGIHTVTHPDGLAFDEAQWRPEIAGCIDFVRDVIGVPAREITGFRAPFLKYNAATFSVLASLGLRYDCSIQEGLQPAHDGTNYLWPYTLDRGSPGDDARLAPDAGPEPRLPIGQYPGLWELPVYSVIVPPDAVCPQYGVPPGLRARLKCVCDFFDEESGKIPGLDYNMWFDFGMTASEFVATLAYSLDLRLGGNRAPFAFVGHTDFYAEGSLEPPNASLDERRRALQEFIEYALARPEVRFVPQRAILDVVRAYAAPVGVAASVARD